MRRKIEKSATLTEPQATKLREIASRVNKVFETFYANYNIDKARAIATDITQAVNNMETEPQKLIETVQTALKSTVIGADRQSVTEVIQLNKELIDLTKTMAIITRACPQLKAV